jgi:hypothetical protein
MSAGSDNQNVLLDLVTANMDLAGLKTETLDYTLNRFVSILVVRFCRLTECCLLFLIRVILLDGTLDGGRCLFNLRMGQT